MDRLKEVSRKLATLAPEFILKKPKTTVNPALEHVHPDIYSHSRWREGEATSTPWESTAMISKDMEALQILFRAKRRIQRLLQMTRLLMNTDLRASLRWTSSTIPEPTCSVSWMASLEALCLIRLMFTKGLSPTVSVSILIRLPGKPILILHKWLRRLLG